MRKKIVAGNWKMNLTHTEGIGLAKQVTKMVLEEVPKDVTAIMCTPAVYLKEVAEIVNGAQVQVGAQNSSEHEKGAYTGEISVKMLSSIGVNNVILGHSERREYFGETNSQLASKVDTALKAGITPIFCCGEALNIREAGTQKDYVTTQVKESLFHLSAEEFKKIIIAYEPIWAIGTGKTASAAQAQEMHHDIRVALEEKYGKDVAEEIPILYGGSCKPSNAKEIFAGEDVDGGLIGGASLVASDFIAIMKSY